MSQENVEIVRALDRGLPTNATAMRSTEILDPDIECYPTSIEPHSVPVRGRDEYMKQACG